MESQHHHFAENLRLLRLQKGLTQIELAEALGLRRNTISHYENGQRCPDLDTLMQLADLLGVTVDRLLTAPPEA